MLSFFLTAAGRRYGRANHPLLRLHSSWTIERLRQSGPGSESKKWVNVCGGGAGDAELQTVHDALKAKGFEPSIVEGPLVTSTTGYGMHAKATLMPLQSASIYAHTKEYLVGAAIGANQPGDLDPDFDHEVSEISALQWGTHSLRRLFDTVALEYAEENDIPKEKIQGMAGWREAERAKDMSTHYDENQLRKRIKAYMVTAKM